MCRDRKGAWKDVVEVMVLGMFEDDDTAVGVKVDADCLRLC